MTILRHPAPVLSLAVGRLDDAEILVAGCADGTVQIWDVEAGIAAADPLPGPTEAVDAVAAGPEHVFASSGYSDLWAWSTEYAGPFPLWSAPVGTSLLAAGRHRDRPAVFAAGGRYVDVYDAGTGDRLTGLNLKTWLGEVYYDNSGRAYADDIEGQDEAVCAFAFGLAAGENLIATSDMWSQWVWDADGYGSMFYNMTSRTRLTGEAGLVGSALAIGRFDGRDVVANAHRDGPVWTHDASTGEPVGPPLRGCTGPARAIAVAGGVVAAIGADATVVVWSGADRPPRTIGLPEPPTALAVSGAGRIAVALSTEVRLLRPEAA